MEDPTASLDRLHDLVPPPGIAWWPWAPGWYLVALLLVFGAVLLIFRLVRKWRASAYRREALRELGNSDNAVAMIEILRRTALALAPRSEIAALQGQAWVDWVAERGPESMPREVQEHLALEVYREGSSADQVPAGLREYIEHWVRHQSEVRERSGKEIPC